MAIVALSGWKQSGKDTVRLMLEARYGFRGLAFAPALKDETARTYGVERSLFDRPETKERFLPAYPVQPRDAYAAMNCRWLYKEFRTASGLAAADWKEVSVDPRTGQHALCTAAQESGAEALYWTPRALCILEGGVKRTVSPRHWSRQTLSGIQNATDLVVISDLRYRAEVNEVIEHAKQMGMPVHLIRINRFDHSSSDDPSEHELDDYPFEHVVDNRAQSLGQLQAVIDQLMRSFNIMPVGDATPRQCC